MYRESVSINNLLVSNKHFRIHCRPVEKARAPHEVANVWPRSLDLQQKF